MLEMNSHFSDAVKSEFKSRKQTSKLITTHCNRGGLNLVSQSPKYSGKVPFYGVCKGFLGGVLLCNQVLIDTLAVM